MLDDPLSTETSDDRSPEFDAFVSGLGEKADELLSAYMDRAAARFIGLISEEYKRFVAKPTYKQVVEVVEFSKTRARTTEDH